ncbi:lipopolysaccharide biosynthesis protein [Kineococcus gynurae]|uniref:Lipopolysaccharide biosynthesis protein n=1 Tax=Kineococcus gynurae TaxID=452979 RepID=A0ABV5LNU7_9ACTN
MSGNLNKAAGRGAAVTLGTQGIRLVVQVIGLSVLGRLLAPHDYGLVAIVTVLVSAGEVFRDFGLSAAAIQAKTVTAVQRSNLFWINLGIGTVLAGLLAAASPLIAHVYDDQRLVGVCLAMASIFVLNGMSTQYRANLARNLQFGRLSGAELTGQVTGVAVAVLVAVLGGGYWALAAQWISAQVMVLTLLLVWSRWLPRRYDRSGPVRPFLRFGANLLGATLLDNSVNYSAPLALGITTSPTGVGVFNRAQQLVSMPLLQLQAPTFRVALPVLSKLVDDSRRYAEMLLRVQLLLLTVIGITFAVLFAQAPAVVRILLGTQWGATVPLFRLLLVAGFFQACTYAANWVFQSKGMTSAQFRYSLWTRPVFVVLIVVGAQWGPYGVAVAYTITTVLGWPASLLWLRRLGVAPVRAMFTNGLVTGVISAAAVMGSWGVTRFVPGPALVQVVVGGLAALLVAAIAALILPGHRRGLQQAVRMLRRRRRGSRTPVEPVEVSAVKS